MDRLTEMHLLLREAGWEPEYTGEDIWVWSLAGCKKKIITDNHRGEIYWHRETAVLVQSVRSLKKRLKELATASQS
jgi:hypothetical protein